MIVKIDSRKAKREFNRLSNEEKAKIVHEQVVSKIQDVAKEEVMKSFISGAQYEGQHLYQKFVERIDQAEGIEREALINRLLSHLREAHLNYVKDRG